MHNKVILETILKEMKNNIPMSILLLVNGPINTNENNKLYDQSYTALIDLITNYKKKYKLDYLRCVISTSDGRVTVDTFKQFEENIKATKMNPINENHNTRPVIMRALEKELAGPEIKISETTHNQEIRMSIRIGDSIIEPIGVISLSLLIDIHDECTIINKYNNVKKKPIYKKIIIR